ncbi:MAG: restriction endonuclease subunit S [Candidatus Latescibacteria bacterium]|nr:restriction endonuclease subunit S [Candidatus Latescibacterota bacterium]
MINELQPYPNYKPSGVEWLGDVPAHWDVFPLKHWLGINEVVLSETTDPNFEFRYIDIGSVGTGVLIEKPQKIRFALAPSRARRVVKDGDRIISTVRTYLRAVWFAEDAKNNFICSTGFVVLSPRQGTLPKFVSYLTQNNSFIDQVTANSVGIAYPAIAESRLGSFQVAVPPFPEQTAILQYLDQADERIRRYISSRERLIELLEEYRQAVIHHAVTRGLDPDVRLTPSGVEWLGDVPAHWGVAAVMQNGPNVPTDIAVPYLKAQHVQWFFIRTTDAPTMWASPHEIERFGIRAGDLLVCEGGEGGRCSLVEEVPPGYIIQNALHRVRSSGNSRNDYLQYMMSSISKTGWFDAINNKATIAHFTAEKFGSLMIPVPPIPEQAAIVAYLDKATADIDAAIDRARREIELLGEYRTRLVADVVTGRVDVREVAADLPDEADTLKSLNAMGETDKGNYL